MIRSGCFWMLRMNEITFAFWNSPKKVDTDQTDRIVSLGGFFEFGSVD